MDKIRVIDNILKTYYDYGFPIQIEEFRDYDNYLSLNDSYDLSCEFLNVYDPNILQLFLNLRSFSNTSFVYKSLDIDKDAENEFNVKTGVVSIVPGFNIGDVYSQCHELIHKIDAPIKFRKDKDLLIEVPTMSTELFINEYLVDNNIYVKDSLNYLYNRMLYCVKNAYFIRYISFISSLPRNLCTTLKRLNKERYNEYLVSMINTLPDYLRYNFLHYYKEYNSVMNKNGYYYNNYIISVSYKYIYAFYLAPYLFQNNSKEMIGIINKASYNSDIKIQEVDEKSVNVCLKNHFNMLSQIDEIIRIKNENPIVK